MKIGMVSTFGPEVRGLSPYADSLASSLESIPGCSLTRFDFSYLYPKFLSPAQTGESINNGFECLNIISPSSWRSVFKPDVDVIHFQYWTFLTLQCYLSIAKKSRKKNIKTIVTVHNPSPHEKLPFIQKLENIFFRRVDHIIVHTDKGRKIIVDRGVPEHKISVIPHGAEIVSLPPTASTKKKQILYFGNIREYKGIDILLSSWDKIKSRYPDYSLRITGRLWTGSNLFHKLTGKLLGADKIAKEVHARCEQADIQTVFELGFIENERLDQLIQESTFAVFPYRKFESQSGAAIRVSGRGTPIVVSDVGGLPELSIDERFVCRANDIGSLESCLSNIIELSQTTEWSELIDKQSYKVSQIDWDIVSQQHAKLYQQLC